MPNLNRICFLFVVVLLAAISAFAQFEAGSVIGTVKDPTGAIIANAKVEIKSLATNSTRETVSNSSGEWSFPALQPGRYQVTVKQSGLRDEVREFELVVGQRFQLDIDMAVGTAAQSITVNASGEMLETSASDMSNVRTTQQVVDLPLNSRNFTQLVQLSPGVNNKGNGTNSTNGGYTAGRGTSGSVVNGNPSDIGIYLFDGIQSVDADANVLLFYPPVDAIQEFKVQTSAAPAAYGGGPSIINVTYRSGGNSLHGTVYEFVRNSDLDAKNYFDQHSLPIPPFHLNQFGGNLSGPIVIPHLFNGRDKLFFFMDYEGKRQAQSATSISTVPTADARNGDLTAYGGFYIPGTASNTATKIPANHINQVTAIDPTSAKLVALFPLPNYGAPGALTNNYIFNGKLDNTIDQGDVRIDFRTPTTSIFGRYTQENANTNNPGYLPSPAIGGGPGYPGITLAPGKQVVLGYGRSFGSSMYYEARLGYSRLVESIVTEGDLLGSAGENYGIPNANAGGVPGFTNIVISGNATLGDGNGSISKVNNLWEVDQAVTLTKGKHEIKAGVSYMSTRFAFLSPAHPNGTINFNGTYTGVGLADFLYGKYATSQLDVSQYFSLIRFRPSIYVQDSYRMTPKLTLNFGLRDDLVTPWTERHNRLAGFDPANGGSLVPVGSGSFPGDAVVDGRYTNFAPRFGFAYNVDSKTVIRGGFGIFYAYETYNSNPMSKNAPFNGSLNVTNDQSSTAGFAAAVPISAGFSPDRPALFPAAGSAFQAYQRRNPNPSANEYNLNLQRQITSHDVISIAYVGQTGVHILINPNINQATPGAGAVASRRPYPNFSDGTLNCYCANSAYNSFQLTYQNHISSNLDFQGTYTLAHSVDTSSGNANLVGPQDPFHLSSYQGRANYRGNSDFDIRHMVVLSWSYRLPFGNRMKFASNAHGIEQAVIGGWQINSIDNFSTGSPFTPVMSSSLLNAGSSVQWPNRIGSGKAANASINGWFNTADFVSPGNYIFGNSGRNIIYGPGTKQFDVSIFKDLNFNDSGSRHLQFRAETFNVFNTPQFNNPSGAGVQIGNKAAGTITSAGQPFLFQRTSREIQLAAKLYF
ncbi:carboxypeptidase regulatory-like domain-containing protein [Granulicella sp. WH15]|uniref:TonB-dependent receptor n=1 Tax=Granulicella sp. WH15 TaxID=2602070 RepID=UPI0013A59D59|nr:carboxypeptidase regulatory-like domain-containing protein [Granulicella sp. WH15]